VTRGRGRPAGGAVFDEATRQQFLDQVAAGAHLGEAATAVGIHRNLPGYHARTDGVFARRLEEALARGKEARADKVPHGEYRYNVLKCRCEICTPAASAARAGRRHAADADAIREPDSPAPVRAVPQAPEPESPTSFLLRSCSSPPGRRAA